MDLKADMERTPGYMDMVEVFEFRYPAAFASFVGMNQRKRSRADLCRELWAAAGLDYPNYARGGLGRPGKVHKPLSVSVTEGGRMADEMMVNIRRGLYAAGAKPERRVTDGTVVDRPGYLDGQICRVRSGDTPVRFESQADG